MKHPVPKQQKPHSKTSSRYKAFRNYARVRLSGAGKTAVCPTCQAFKLPHRVCASCGQYHGRQVLDMKKKIEKITKIKA